MSIALTRWNDAHDDRPLVDDGKPDVDGYNKELETLGIVKWSSVPWLYSECYLYRYDLVESLLATS